MGRSQGSAGHTERRPLAPGHPARPWHRLQGSPRRGRTPEKCFIHVKHFINIFQRAKNTSDHILAFCFKLNSCEMIIILNKNPKVVFKSSTCWPVSGRFRQLVSGARREALPDSSSHLLHVLVPRGPRPEDPAPWVPTPSVLGVTRRPTLSHALPE